MANRIDTPEYWIEDFKPTSEELDRVYAHVLERMAATSATGLAELLIQGRVEQAMTARRISKAAGGTVYAPAHAYKVGDKLVFSALGGQQGVVEALRPGNNPAYGAYDVLQVTLGGQQREFAANLGLDHSLTQVETDLDADEIVAKFSSVVAPQLATLLARDGEWLNTGNGWILNALLPEISTVDLNLAEAIILTANQPLPAEQILDELDLDRNIPIETRVLAFEQAMARDSRFRNVGAIESPLWTLKA